MKTFIYLFSLTLFSCTLNGEDIPRTHVLSVLSDRTEEDFISKPNADKLLNVFDINKELWDEYIFRESYLTEVDFNYQTVLNLPQENKYTGNSILRKHFIKAFADSIRRIVENPKPIGEQKKSSIIPGIARELSYLAQFPDADVQLFVFSDLLENDAEQGGFSYYRKQDRKKLIKDPNSLAIKLLDGFDKTLDYSHTKLTIVYQAKNSDDNLKFREILRVYDLIFKELHIPYTVKANL